ncbi:MAG: hypothetical protein R3F05_01490 [Planctomycetota bacterium]|nr:hypothetical protein [Planctomycetota bacterium]MCB9899988.1 hypothetical protein [Planctomycetota bacterium]
MVRAPVTRRDEGAATSPDPGSVVMVPYGEVSPPEDRRVPERNTGTPAGTELPDDVKGSAPRSERRTPTLRALGAFVPNEGGVHVLPVERGPRGVVPSRPGAREWPMA